MVPLILEMMFGDVFEWNQSDTKLWNKSKIIFLMIKKVTSLPPNFLFLFLMDYVFIQMM